MQSHDDIRLKHMLDSAEEAARSEILIIQLGCNEMSAWAKKLMLAYKNLVAALPR